MTKHTPGPWEAITEHKRSGGPVYRIQQATPRYPNIPDMQHTRIQIGETYSHRFGSADNVPGDGMHDLAHADREGCQQANARLIAAAPELYAALKEIVTFVSPGDDVEFGRMIEDAKIALAKATGQ